VGACPLGSLQNALDDKSALFYVGGILLLYSILFGRLICGWLCPFGLIQELLHKIKTPKVKKSPVTRILSYLKYVILVLMVFVLPPLLAGSPAFCKFICPAGTSLGGLGLMFNPENHNKFLGALGPLFTWKFLLMVGILVGCIFVFRLFCRFICPLGALYGLFNRFSFFGIKLNRDKCVDCNKCVKQCKMDIRHVGDPECISCGECVSVCPTQAIEWKGPKILVKPSEALTPMSATEQQKKKTRLWVRVTVTVALLGLLIGTGIYHWNESAVPLPSPAGQTEDGDVVRGNQVGDYCYNPKLEIINESGVTGEQLEPASTGKITVLNFWGTWCPPCVAELPDFERIARDYADRVVVVAVHGGVRGKEDAPPFIAENFPNSPIVFTLDSGAARNDYHTLLNGPGYPYTLILDENGVIAEVFPTAIHYQDLKTAIDSLLDTPAQ